MMQKHREEEQRRVKKFKDSLQGRIDKFVKDEEQERFVLEVMNKPERAIV